MIKIISILLSVTFVAGCSTVAGVGQDVQDVANWGRNKIVEQANKKDVVQQELTEEELNAENDIEWEG
jgi:predicted small secreted protein